MLRPRELLSAHRETNYVRLRLFRRGAIAAATAAIAAAAASGLQSFAPDDVAAATDLGALRLVVPTYKYGLEVERFGELREGEVARGTTLSELLDEYSDDKDVKARLLLNALQKLDESSLRAGTKLTAFHRAGAETPDYVVYEASSFQQIVFDFVEGDAYAREDEVDTELVNGSAVVESNLWNAVKGAGYSNRVALGVTRAIEMAIPLRNLDKGDAFDMIYERKLVDGEEKGQGRVKLARLSHRGEDIYAIHFARPEAGINGYYDLAGESVQHGYLLNPVKGSRLSSGYNLRRFHPILKRRRPHYGTDFAAPHGRPIMSVADGVVEKVSRSRGNGKFVKIKHDERRATQYLHMSKHVKGMKVGDRVVQGQTIGYVGSTGLSTGPHVCFRFWLDGRQVNHLTAELPKANPLPTDLVAEFEAERDALLARL